MLIILGISLWNDTSVGDMVHFNSRYNGIGKKKTDLRLIVMPRNKKTAKSGSVVQKYDIFNEAVRLTG